MKSITAWLAPLAMAGSMAVHAQSPVAPTQDPSPPVKVKPVPNPSPPLGTRANSESSQLPAGTDAGEPGVGQNLPLGTAGLTHSLRRRPPAPSASDAARSQVNDGAAAKLAATPRPGAAASSTSR